MYSSTVSMLGLECILCTFRENTGCLIAKNRVIIAAIFGIHTGHVMSTSTQATDSAFFNDGLTVSSLGNYIQWVNRIPFLTDEADKAYATDLQESNNVDAARS